MKVGTSVVGMIVFLAWSFPPAVDAAENSWRTHLPDRCLRYRDSPSIEPVDLTHAWEVPESKMQDAASRLAEKNFLILDEGLTEYYLPGEYEPDPERTPFLVRAVYGWRGTGQFSIFWCGNDLVVSHGSLGRSWEEHDTALIVNLGKHPESVFVTMGIDE